jgi:8-oxo-dGTP pyrophosphatase MutT (NUDIX family)
MCQATRRGYARAQLWTQASNVRARALYDRDGFELTGREMIHDISGELLVHYHRELPTMPWQSRAAARLVCLDPDDRVLLLHWRDPYDGFQLWEPPGGGVEAGESAYDAVVREWSEETGLPLPDLAPNPTTVGRDCIFNGVRGVTDETFFLGRAESAGVPVTDASTPVEQETLLGHAWVHWREMDALDDPREPDLLPVLARLTGGGIGVDSLAG